MALRDHRRWIAPTAVIALSLALAPAASAEAGPSLDAAFEKAASKYKVPKALLISVAYSNTRLSMHGGRPSQDNGFGIMHLVDNPSANTLAKAAKLTGRSKKALRTDAASNILGGAAVLRSLAGKLDRSDINKWYPAVAAYSNAKNDSAARLFADSVYDNLGLGIRARGVSVEPRLVRADRGKYAKVAEIGVQSEDYPPAKWVAANSSNYSSGRSSSISAVVIHTTQGSYSGTISWFQNPSANVSAHYVVRSADGEVTQMVRERDTAWHARDGNSYSVGIEHEGYVDDPSWYTEAMYESSAAISRHLIERYNIPADRDHIVGHSEVPGNDHTDPGPNWDWNHYMDLINGDGNAWKSIVDNATEGGFTAAQNWAPSSYSSQKYGDNYMFSNPITEDGLAQYKVAIPEDGKYRVDVWYPSLPGYNDVAPYTVATADGPKQVFVDQRSGGGSWKSIGEYNLTAGESNLVSVNARTDGTGYVIADAIRVVATG